MRKLNDVNKKTKKAWLLRLKNRAERRQTELQESAEVKLQTLSELEESTLFKTLGTTLDGWTEEEAEDLLWENGPNEITRGRKKHFIVRFINALINPFNIVLIVIALVQLITELLSSDDRDFLTISIILILVLVSSIISFIQSERSNNAVEKLSDMVTNNADVLRDGKYVSLPMDELVVGDIVKLSAGDMIPADVRFLEVKDMFIAQSALTGESHPVEKTALRNDQPNRALTDYPNIGFMGSNVISGSATAVILLTGDDTFFGSMVQVLAGERGQKSFERGVRSVSRLLMMLTLFLIPLVFIITSLKMDWNAALLFSVSIAVGLTPEMLPVIMTSTLAKGAVSMAKHKVIVKSLGTIQTFGEMDILCTDKTGTLTEDRIILEKYINVHGDDDERVLRHAYLNSYFQTGLKSLIDVAVINRMNQKGLSDIKKRYTKVDEIPFDFVRRRMSVVLVDDDDKRQLITKGAVEEMLAICKFAEIKGVVVPLTEEIHEYAMATYLKYNDDGLRIMAVAQKNEVPDEHSFGVSDESEMVLIGFIGFLDPPKESAKGAIGKLKEHGVRTIVLTGDSEGVTAKVCSSLEIGVGQPVISGSDVANMTDDELVGLLKTHDLYAKLTPAQKERIVGLLQNEGHTVGYMGDGINDAPALHRADVGISVDSGVDIAKETADIILLEKDLMVLEEGVIEGRKTFGNITKYIKMAASGNFGNMIAVLFAAIFLPFLPMLPIHLLVQNLLNDISQLGMPFDNVGETYLQKPRKWDAKSIRTFTFIMGPLSSIFDIMIFGVLFFILGYNTTLADGTRLFQTGWFVFGTISQILVIYAIRTSKIPIIQSRPSLVLTLTTIIVSVIALVIGFTSLGSFIGLAVLEPIYLLYLLGVSVLYILSVEFVKRLYIKKFGDWM